MPNDVQSVMRNRGRTFALPVIKEDEVGAVITEGACGLEHRLEIRREHDGSLTEERAHGQAAHPGGRRQRADGYSAGKRG